jgi:signal transduction histidine kinase/HPt (histidine-containing phosphotransfer) domain-containing protein
MIDQAIHVLLIEDSPTDAQLLQIMLSQCQGAIFNVQLSGKLEDGRRQLKENQPDVVLMDLSLPDSSGLDGFDKLRAGDKTVPIIVLTGLNDQTVATQAVKKGAEDFLIKDSIDANLLERSILYAIERARNKRQIIELNEELVVARDQALAIARFKAEFLAHMSHEIRTPMNAVIGMTDLLRRSPLSRDQQRFVDIIQQSGRVLLDVINDILVFSKIEAGKLGLENTVFNLLRTVESAIDIVADKAREKSIYISSFISPDVPASISGDAQRLRQVLLNLVSNAVKFTDAGSVSVVVSLLERNGSTVRLKFEVKDTGQGLDQSDTERIFEPFIQSRNERSQGETSSGLGLAIAKRLVHMMNGEIWTESRLGEGSTFNFTAELGVPVSGQESNHEEFASKRILFSSLDKLDSEVFVLYADAAGIKYDIASDFKSTLQLLDRPAAGGTKYDLVIVDFQDPDKVSEFQDFVKELAKRNVAMAIIRPFDQVDFLERIFERDLAHHLNRPLRQTEFYNCLRDAFDTDGKTSGAEFETQFDEQLLKMSTFDLSIPILVAEDNLVNREVVKLQLRRLGLNPALVSNGAQVLEEMERNHYDVILMDCQMPRMDGVETTRRIRQMEAGTERHVIIIALTANALEGDRQRCLDAGMDDFIAKPVTIEKLGHVLRKWQPSLNSGQALSPDSSGGELSQIPVHISANLAAAAAEEGEEEPLDDFQEDELIASYLQEQSQSDDAVAKRASSLEANLVKTYGETAGQRIFELFLSSTPKLINKIEVSLSTKDNLGVKAAAHELKGQCAIVKADRMVLDCRELEKFALAGDWDNIRQVIAQLKISYAQSIQVNVH